MRKILVWILACAGVCGAQAPAGSVAEPGRWNGPRGTAAGTFRSAAMPILRAPEEAWRYELPGPAAGAPVLWDGVAYVLCRDGKRRELLAIDVLTGEKRADRSFRSGPLVPPVVAAGLVLVKTEPAEIIGYRLGRSSFSQRWKPDFREFDRLGDPLVVDDEVYVVGDGRSLMRWDVRGREPAWTNSRYEIVGQPAACGDHVFVLHHAAQPGYEPSLHVATFRRATGGISGYANVAWYLGGGIPRDAGGASISVMEERIYVTSTAPLSSSAGGRSYASLPCRIREDRVQFVDKVGLRDIVVPPSWHPDGALFLSMYKNKLGWSIQKKEKSWGLTDRTEQPDLVRHRLPATTFGRVAYFGWWAADLETDEVLWRLPVESPKFAAVPGDRLVLVVDGHTLRAFRERGEAPPGAVEREGTVPARLAVRRDGDVLDGDLSVAFDEGKLYEGKRDHALHRFYVVEADGGKLVWAEDFAGRVRGYELLARARLRDELERIAADAARKKAAISRRYLEQAEEAGLEGRDAERLEKRVERAERRPKEPDTEEVKEWEAAAARARAILPGLLAERAKVELAAGDETTGLRLLRESLRLDRDNAPARKLLQERAPKDFKLGSPWFWLNLHLDLLQAGASVASDDELELKRARYHWRKDAYGLRAGPILLITPTKDTRSMGRCLAYGRMTCDVLGELFATDAPRKRRKAPLVIHLFESRKEYQTKSGIYDSEKDPETLAWGAGHYSPTDAISRFFWYDDPAVERRLAATCVHEITHHWLREQCPQYASSEVRRGPKCPGHWIVEGFASFVEDGVFDIDSGQWTLFNPRSRALDYVRVLAKQNALIDWERLYAITPLEFRLLKKKEEFSVVSRWMLGRRKISEKSMFYKQSNATCAYLYHGEDGKYREALLQFVVDFYTGKEDRVTPQAAFGMSGAELGKRVHAFADEVAKGWVPGKG